MIEIDLDKPEKPDDIDDWACKLCGSPMRVTHYWLIDRWIHPTVHFKCLDDYDRARTRKSGGHDPREAIPEKYREFDADQFNNHPALSRAQSFTPDSALKTIAIVGGARQGKSRLMWHVVYQFFQIIRERTGQERWVDHYHFADLISELDKTLLAKAKLARYLFVSDIGSVDSYGRERAALQQVIRARVQKQQWTFLDIDSFDFDPGLEDILSGLALTVTF